MLCGVRVLSQVTIRLYLGGVLEARIEVIERLIVVEAVFILFSYFSVSTHDAYAFG